VTDVDPPMVTHELPADTRADRCPRCGARFADLPATEGLTEDPDLVTCDQDGE
jgi:hypothetical protein